MGSQIVPDVTRQDAMEIFSVDEVVSVDPASHDPIVFDPFYSYRHKTARDKKQGFWHGTRRPTTRRNSEAIDVYLSLVDLSGKPIRPNVDTVTVRLTCTNGDLPSRLPFGKTVVVPAVINWASTIAWSAVATSLRSQNHVED